MSVSTDEMLGKILETFVSKADSISATLLELRTAISTLNSSNQAIISKLDEIRLELRELSTRIEVALRR